MAEVQQNDGGKGKKKGHQKKMTIRVDFTPMVDMNMLLITFFMLCTTMIKSQTLNIALPSNAEVQNEADMNQASSDEAITIIVDAKKKLDSNGKWVVDSLDHKPQTAVYYYEGKPANGAEVVTVENNNLKASEFAKDKGEDLPEGIRKIIRNRNKEVYAEYKKLKERFIKKEINDSVFNSLAKANRNDSRFNLPFVIIKATPEASYGDLVKVLDEMQINQIARYQIDNLTPVDSTMVVEYLKTNAKR